MVKVLIIGCGGFIGAVLRYAVSGLVQNLSRSISFPYGTLVVNLIGCLLIGFLSHLVDTRGIFAAQTRFFLFIGLLGAFTTYSTFGNETINLLRDKEHLLAFLYVAAHLLLGLSAVWAGRWIANQI